MNDIILKVDHLSKYFALVKALDDISFDVRRGEVHALCGENGAGKSTFIKLLTGAYEPTKGTIEFEHKVYEKNDTEVIHGFGNIGYLSGVQSDSISDSCREHFLWKRNSEIWNQKHKRNESACGRTV